MIVQYCFCCPFLSEFLLLSFKHISLTSSSQTQAVFIFCCLVSLLLMFSIFWFSSFVFLRFCSFFVLLSAALLSDYYKIMPFSYISGVYQSGVTICETQKVSCNLKEMLCSFLAPKASFFKEPSLFLVF